MHLSRSVALTAVVTLAVVLAPRIPLAPGQVDTSAAPVPVDLSALTASWPRMHASAPAAPQLPPVALPAPVRAGMPRLATDLVSTGHLSPATLAGSDVHWDRLSTHYGRVPGAVDPAAGLAALTRVTRFADGWRVSEIRAQGGWTSVVPSAGAVDLTWSGSIAYDIRREGRQQTVVIARTQTVRYDAVNGSTSLQVSIGGAGVDWCASHRAGAWVPGSAPTSAPTIVTAPGAPASWDETELAALAAKCWVPSSP